MRQGTDGGLAPRVACAATNHWIAALVLALAGAWLLLACSAATAQTTAMIPPGSSPMLSSGSGPMAPVGSTAAPPSGTAGRAAAEYRITPGDELDISVWGEERMQRTVRVLSDGTFAFPLAGTIPASGQTVKEVSDTIRNRIASNYRVDAPDVTVGLRAAAGMSFYVVGKVRTPGSFATGRAVNVVQALSMAGGLAEFADVKHAVILRQTPSGQVVEPVKLASILKGQRRLEPGALAQALPELRSGDVLVIP